MYAYDNAGNPLTFGDRSYTWEHGRQLASLTENGTTWTYTYDADGLRTIKTNGTTTYTYLYKGGKLTYMTGGGRNLYFSYDASGKPYAMWYGTTNYYYVTNLQGDVIGILDNAGNQIVTYTYDAWGNILDISGSHASTIGQYNPLRYRGYVYDTETGLYYLQSRYYDPSIGRFLNADAFTSTGQGLLGNNMFAYCRNNPVSRRDTAGLEDETSIDCTPNFDEEKETGKSSTGAKYGGSNSSFVTQSGNGGNGRSTPTNGSGSNPVSGNISTPKEAYDIRDYVNTHNGSPPKGYKGGKEFKNDGRNGSQILPNQYGPFYEYDIYPLTKGMGRGTVRIVIGNGMAWYTPDHYMTFFEME